MSQRGESSSSTRPVRRQEQGRSSVRSHGGHGLPYPVGDGTGLPLVMCPDCGLARVIELRVVQDTSNKGRSFFKCPRNGNPKQCGFYRFAKQYLDELIRLGVVVIKEQELVEDEEVCSVEDEQRKDLEKKLANLSLKLNCLLGLVVFLIVMVVVISIAKAAGPFAM